MKALNNNVLLSVDNDNISLDSNTFSSEIGKINGTDRCGLTFCGKVISVADEFFTPSGIQKNTIVKEGDWVVCPLAMIEVFSSPARKKGIVSTRIEKLIAVFESVEEVIDWVGHNNDNLLT